MAALRVMTGDRPREHSYNVNDDVLAPSRRGPGLFAEQGGAGGPRRGRAQRRKGGTSARRHRPVFAAGHFSRFGRMLDNTQVQRIVTLAANAKDPALKEQADLTVASVRAEAAAIGDRLKGFIPAIPRGPTSESRTWARGTK